MSIQSLRTLIITLNFADFVDEPELSLSDISEYLFLLEKVFYWTCTKTSSMSLNQPVGKNYRPLRDRENWASLENPMTSGAISALLNLCQYIFLIL